MSDTGSGVASDTSGTSATVTAASIAVLVAVVGLVVSTWLWGAATDGPSGTPADATAGDTAGAAATLDSTSAPAPVAGESPVGVLRAWDRRRADAWSTGDAAGLARLYADGAEAGRRDVAMLRRWNDRGLRVHGMRMQVLDVDVRRATDRRVVVHVTDRLTGAVAERVDDGRRWELPADRAETRRLVFRRTTSGWVLAAAYDRPLATIAATSGSDIS
ncbi:hypothetical protein KUV85_06530 [Nocardioides panacisoli]|uniref:hypothetical protein n=1 Tax=Nocardioides panacisoli TaxID=627624 RepID=UPI001C636A0D|nr:hypothetical protein [Nocardioides panacisoli]QYJ05329.1 hypothetical protein KUV85_06530 [Nocardioides panacisoli]